MGTKDRERARRRRAILRAQQQATTGTADTDPGDDAAGGGRGDRRDRTRPAGRGRDRTRGGGGRGQQVSPLAVKAKAGDRDHRGRIRTRDMLVHPRISFYTLLACFLLSLPGLFMPRLQLLTWVAYTVAFLALADLSRTKVHAFICLVGGAFSFSLLVSQVLLLVRG